jgi:hypothetical protein
MNRQWMLYLGLAISALPTHAQTQPKKVVLVELFTSEGCSSCPPADALLRQVNGTETSAGQLVVGISEHVTYWNSLGWSDPYSLPGSTERQNDYGQRFHLEGVYTPQMVINGAEEIVGSDRAALVRALEKEQQQTSSMTLRIVSLHQAGGTVTVTYAAAGTVPARGADLLAVLADDSDRSNVLRGENSGETLTHVAVARSLARIATVQTAGEHTVEVKIPASFQPGQKHHLILFAQTPGNGRVLAADTRPL